MKPTIEQQIQSMIDNLPDKVIRPSNLKVWVLQSGVTDTQYEVEELEDLLYENNIRVERVRILHSVTLVLYHNDIEFYRLKDEELKDFRKVIKRECAPYIRNNNLNKLGI